jgi:hypothetical protein
MTLKDFYIFLEGYNANYALSSKNSKYAINQVCTRKNLYQNYPIIIFLKR